MWFSGIWCCYSGLMVVQRAVGREEMTFAHTFDEDLENSRLEDLGFRVDSCV